MQVQKGQIRDVAYEIGQSSYRLPSTEPTIHPPTPPTVSSMAGNLLSSVSNTVGSDVHTL